MEAHNPVTPAQFNELGDTLTRALLDGNFELYKTVMTIPHRAVPRDGEPYELNTEEELRADFDLYAQALAINHVTDIFRDIVAIMPMEDDRIEVTVETNMLSGAQRIVEPFRTQFELVSQDDDWRITTVRSSLGHINWSRGRAHISRDGRFTDT